MQYTGRTSSTGESIMQKLEVFQSLWAMEYRQPNTSELSFPQAAERIKNAGYRGIALDTGTDNPALYAAASTVLNDHGLHCIVTAFPDSVDAMKSVLDVSANVSAQFVCVNAQIFPMTPAEGADIVEQILALGREWQVPVYFETHRLTLTTDLLFTLQVLDLVPDLELVCDLSHYVVARELPNPVDDFWLALMSRIINRGAAFQGRVASREQVQVPIHFPQHQYWFDTFKAWWTEGFQSWRTRKGEHDVLNFLCELGPTPYAITDANGFDLSDRWQEALDIKRCVERIWSQTM